VKCTQKRITFIQVLKGKVNRHFLQLEPLKMQQLSRHSANPISSALQTLQLEQANASGVEAGAQQKSLKLSAVTRWSVSVFFAACKWNCGWASLLFIKSPSHTHTCGEAGARRFIWNYGARASVFSRVPPLCVRECGGGVFSSISRTALSLS